MSITATQRPQAVEGSFKLWGPRPTSVARHSWESQAVVMRELSARSLVAAAARALHCRLSHAPPPWPRRACTAPMRTGRQAELRSHRGQMLLCSATSSSAPAAYAAPAQGRGRSARSAWLAVVKLCTGALSGPTTCLRPGSACNKQHLCTRACCKQPCEHLFCLCATPILLKATWYVASTSSDGLRRCVMTTDLGALCQLQHCWHCWHCWTRDACASACLAVVLPAHARLNCH
jgi:hypothetical protein